MKTKIAKFDELWPECFLIYFLMHSYKCMSVITYNCKKKPKVTDIIHKTTYTLIKTKDTFVFDPSVQFNGRIIV